VGELLDELCSEPQRLLLLDLIKPSKRMAGTTRLELATSAVTGQRSNQLNYVPAIVLLVVGGHGFEPRTFPV
jgi:hypothetical protein